MQCGASFASDDAKYQTDGRTVSDKDDTAYLREGPPKYTKSHKGLILVIVLGVLIAGMMLVMADRNGPNTSLSYDYEITDISDYGSDSCLVTAQIRLSNDSSHVIQYSEVAFKVEVDNTRYSSNWSVDGMLEPGWYTTRNLTFTIDAEDKDKPMTIVAISKLSIKQDKNLL